MSGNQSGLQRRKISLGDVKVGTAHSARQYSKQHITVSNLRAFHLFLSRKRPA
jgi:hypothetical protein